MFRRNVKGGGVRESMDSGDGANQEMVRKIKMAAMLTHGRRDNELSLT